MQVIIICIWWRFDQLKQYSDKKIPLKCKKCYVEKLLLYYFYSLHDRNVLYHQMLNGDKKTELLQISLGYLSKIKHAWSFVISDHTPIHREVQTLIILPMKFNSTCLCNQENYSWKQTVNKHLENKYSYCCFDWQWNQSCSHLVLLLKQK